MKRSFLPLLALAIAATPAMAQAPKISGLVQVWYTQMMDTNLRTNSASVAPNKYYNLRSEFTENSFVVRRAEIKLSGKINEEVEYEMMIDPSIATSATNPMILQDAAIVWKAVEGFELKLGQFKTLQTYEGLTSSSEILFAERSQLGRVFGDKRDRGAVASYAFGDPKEFGAKLSVAAFNGMSDALSGKGNDTNGQKDMVARLDMNYGKSHKFGFYTLQASTDQADKASAPLTARTFAGTAPTTAEILDNKDKSTNMGAFYAYTDSSLTVVAEYITGLLGRRAASLGSGAAAREHLDQKFAGFYLAGAYTMGNHTVLARYDMMNYNSGDQWYTATNPYKTNVGTGAATGIDYSPKFTEITLGYTYAFLPEKVKAANFKLNYVMRSKNFLKPYGTQTTEQGGDTIVAAFQIAF